MAAALRVSKASTCLGPKVGSVIVQEERIIATGFNAVMHGLPSCAAKGECYPRLRICTGGTLPSMAIHAEVAAIGQAAQWGAPTLKASIYVTRRPCLNCLKAIAAAGMTEIFYLNEQPEEPIGAVWQAYTAMLSLTQLDLPAGDIFGGG
jgi:dCMP deaminase